MTKPIRVGVPDAAALGYDTFVADPIPMNVAGPLPNGESHMFSARDHAYLRPERCRPRRPPANH